MSSVTPSGMSIDVIEGGRGRKYVVTRGADVIEVPSVTTVLDIQSKPALPWWGMKVGVEGFLKLIEDGTVMGVELDHPSTRCSSKEIVDLLTEHKLTVNHTLTKAGDRGTRVHDAFEAWCREGVLPSLFREGEDQGYLNGLRGLLEAIAPYAEVEHVEVHVASVEYGFAGRTDAIITFTDGPLTNLGRYIVDLKTSSGIYSSHFRQLAAYQYAALESGYGDTDGGLVFWVGKDGDWKIRRSTATFEGDFLPALYLWESEQELKKGLK